MQLNTMVEIISAVHLSRYVESPFRERGGLMLIAPPESLKTSLLDVLNFYPDAMVLSDLNNQQLAKGLRDDIAAGRISTLAFGEFNKLYQRNPAVAAGMEGNIAQLVGEGLRFFGHEDARMPVYPARCSVIGCMTPALFKKNFSDWKESGFYRRFLWSTFRLENPEIIIQAIEEWKKIDFSGKGFVLKVPASRSIPYRVEPEENNQLRLWLKYQSGGISFSLLKKILCVLRWKYKPREGEPDRAMQILKDFAPSLGETGAQLSHDRSVVAKKAAKNGSR
jgi:hypothetical protein